MLLCPECKTHNADELSVCDKCSHRLGAADFVSDTATDEAIEAHLERRSRAHTPAVGSDGALPNTASASRTGRWRRYASTDIPPLVPELAAATSKWTAPFVVRSYEVNPGGADGQSAAEREARVLFVRGYAPDGQTEVGSHVHVGRLLLTGGFSIFAGRAGIRSKGKLSVTFRKLFGAPVDIVVDKVARSGDCRRALATVLDWDVSDGPFPLILVPQVPEAQAAAIVDHLKSCCTRIRIVRDRESGSSAPGGQTQQGEDPIAALERLARLRDQGVLTEDEFETTKARLLKQIG